MSRRGLKRIAAMFLPEIVQKRIRGRFYGYHDSRVNLSVAYEKDDRGGVLVLDGRVRLPFQDDEREELKRTLVGASLEETSGVLAFAATARTLFDVGAATAFYSRVFCACGPDRRAIAFEPSPSQLLGATMRIAHAGLASSIELRACAVGQTAGRATVRVADNGFAAIETLPAGPSVLDVEVTTLDCEVERLGFEPDLVKIDVEGFEYEVLIGARKLLARRRPPICLELHLGLLERRGIAPRLVVDELLAHGYAFHTYHGSDLAAADVWDSMHGVLRIMAEVRQ